MANFSFSQAGSGSLPEDELKSADLSELKIYPNPARECTFFEYSIPADCEKSIVRIYNIIGEEIERIEPDGLTGKIKINTFEYEPGLYIVKMINAGHEILSRKFRVVR